MSTDAPTSDSMGTDAMSTGGTGTDAPTAPTDPGRRIGDLRREIDACDAEIIRLIQQRLTLSREIGALRTASGGTRLSLSREQQVLARFSDELGPDGTSLGMLLLRRGRGVL